jgi:REP element-mobilizing transposase RayT
MANTYTQLYVQAVFPVKYRASLISKEIRNDLFGVIGQEIHKTGCKSFIVNGTEDHVHILFGLHPAKSIGDVLKMAKGNSSKWVNDTEKLKHHFQWQPGYGAFSYSKKDVDRVYQYVANQQAHHSKRNFLEEYRELLDEHEVDYQEQFLFHLPI